MGRFLAAWLLGAAILLSTVLQADALSCEPPRPVQEEMEHSSVVFKGRAIEIKKGGLTVFQIEKAWKGVNEPIIEIYDNGWDPYKKGTVYLIFGGEREGELRRHLCGRTGPWDTAREQAMNESQIVPVTFNDVSPKDNERPPIVVILLTAFIFFLIALVVVLWRGRRRHIP